MENENLFNLIWSIVKAILLFVFRIALLIPMIMLAIVAAMVGASEKNIGEAFWTCISHPFKALAEAIGNISYAIKTYKNNK